MAPPATDQCIVLPLQPSIDRSLVGNGLALHFLLGNVLVLHPGLKEMWFGWRVKRIFAREEEFRAFYQSATQHLDLVEISRRQQVRFWISGTVKEESVHLSFLDADRPHAAHAPITLPYSTADSLTGFRSRFVQWWGTVAQPMPDDQVQAALWPETIDRQGLDAVGRALAEFYAYSAYGENGTLDLTAFKKAVVLAPESFMAQDLYGWACYRNGDYATAKSAFLASVRINPSGAGAMAGLMWCGVYGKDQEEAIFWAGRKADVCRKDVQAAREAGRRRYEKFNR